ncbi:MAG: BatA domain-containing protein [Gammaproteobacteria bacterium]|nr:BatA domain-containing protein [Gammaproteobacteria bacterium]
MGFLTPLFLLGLLAAAIPVAIHLIRRENPPKVMFGTLRFMKQTTKKLILFQQIQQWLLLLMRAALICLLVLAFARPLFYQGSIARLMDAEPRSVAVLLDTSLSMRFGDRFERAKEQALDVLDELNAGDEAAVLTFADGTLNVRELTSDIDALRAFVTALEEPGYDRVRFYPVLQQANDLLAGSQHENRQLVMISDFKAAGVTDNEPDFMLAAGTGFRTIDVGDERSSNLSLTDVRSPQQLLENQSDYEVLARVRSTGSVFLDRGALSLALLSDSADAAPSSPQTQQVQLDERSEAVLSLPLTLEGSGSYTGELALSGDDFELDNRWYFSMDVLPRMRVLVVNGDPAVDWYDDEAHWFVLALQGMENSPFDVTTTTSEALSPVQLREQDAVVLLNTPLLANSMVSALEDFVSEQGGALWLAPGDRVSADGFNSQFAQLSPARLIAADVLPANDYQLIADVDRRHPALRALNVDFGARFQGYWQTEPASDASVLMRFDNGSAMLSERQAGEGRTMLLSSSLDLGWSNFPLQGLYLPFAHEVLTYLIQPPSRERAYLVGQTIDLSAFVPESGQLVVVEPDGNQVRIAADNAFYRARMPGFIEAGETTLAVNIAPEAASLTKLDIAGLTDRIINPETTPMVSERVRTAQLIAEVEQPQRLWWWIVLLVMLLLAVEAWVANRTYR